MKTKMLNMLKTQNQKHDAEKNEIQKFYPGFTDLDIQMISIKSSDKYIIMTGVDEAKQQQIIIVKYNALWDQ